MYHFAIDLLNHALRHRTQLHFLFYGPVSDHPYLLIIYSGTSGVINLYMSSCDIFKIPLKPLCKFLSLAKHVVFGPEWVQEKEKSRKGF